MRPTVIPYGRSSTAAKTASRGGVLLLRLELRAARPPRARARRTARRRPRASRGPRRPRAASRAQTTPVPAWTSASPVGSPISVASARVAGAQHRPHAVAAALLLDHGAEDQVAAAVAADLGDTASAAIRYAASPPFMSPAPRPQMRPSAISPPHGSCAPRSSRSTGTTSTWPVRCSERPPPAPRSRPTTELRPVVGQRRIAGVRIGERRLGVRLDALDLEPARRSRASTIACAGSSSPSVLAHAHQLADELDELLAPARDAVAQRRLARSRRTPLDILDDLVQARVRGPREQRPELASPISARTGCEPALVGRGRVPVARSPGLVSPPTSGRCSCERRKPA